MKLLFSIIFATLLVGQAWAFKSGDLYYNITSSSAPYTVEVIFKDVNIGLNYSGLSYTIPETVTYNGIEYMVTGIGYHAFLRCTGLVSVTLPESITSISDAAFYECGSLTSITIPQSVTSIGGSAFYGCSSLTSVTIPNSVTSIGYDAFCNCHNLASISIPASVTSIGNAAFSNGSAIAYCEPASRPDGWEHLPFKVIWNVRAIFSDDFVFDVISDTTVNVFQYIGNNASIEIPSVVTSYGIEYAVVGIGKSAFSGHSELSKVTIPNTVTYIDDYAFNGCTNLTTITIPNSVKKIGSAAFNGCSELTSITIPESVTRVGMGTFGNCDKLDYNVYDNGCYIGNEENPYMIMFKSKKQDIISCAVHNKCKIIGGYAFNGCSNLASVTIPESVVTIGDGAFNSCSNLTSITIPESVVTISNDAFNGCYSLTSAEFASISSLCGINFESPAANPLTYTHHLYVEGEEITELSIPNTVTTISDYAFSGCNNLKSLSIPNSVTSIGINAFEGCKSLKYLAIQKNVENIGNSAFKNCDSLVNVTIVSNADFSNATLSFINNGLRYRVLNKNSVEVSKTALTITEWVSAGGWNWESHTYQQVENSWLIMPTTITAGNTYNVVGVGESAFENCNNLASIVIPNSITNIGDNAFKGCSELKSITIPESVTTIGKLAFVDCNNILSLEFNTDAIETHFAEKPMLKSVHIGETVTNISTSSFKNCNQLTIVTSAATIPPTLPDGDPFPKADTIYVQAGSVEAYQTAPYWKRKVILPYTPVTIKNYNDSVGTIEGSRFLLGDKGTTLTAIPAEGYHFTKWYDGNTDNPRQFTTAINAEITASFEKHTIVVDSTVAATCSATGLTEGSHCSVCGKVIKEQFSIGMTPHHIVIDSAVATTCTTNGLSEGAHCDVCGTVLSQQYEYPAWGHEFSNYIYNNDATTTADGTETATCWRCGATDTRVAQGTKLATAISESSASNLMVHAHGNTIIAENADAEIFVYDAMGRLVGRDAINRVRAELQVNTAGVYIVKVGYVTKRVMVN